MSTSTSKTRSKQRVVKLTAKQYDLLVSIIETRAIVLDDLGNAGVKELKEVDALLSTLDEYELK